MHKTPKMFKPLVRMVQQFFRIVRFCCRVTPLYSAKYFSVFLRAVRLCCKERFSPKEAFRLGLFNPNLSTNELSKYISRKKWTKVQESLNPTSWAPLAKDKSIFYRYCMALGFPIPKLYAIFFRKTAGWSYKGSALTTRDDWKRFFELHLPSEFVIKPSQGAYGQGLNVFHKSNKKFIDASGRSYKSEDLYDALLSNPKHNSFIIQEQLKNHPELVRLSNTQSLQTVRIISFVDSDYNCHILYAHFKPIVDQHVIDTFLDGLTGNVEAAVSLTDGVLKPANQITSSGQGIKTIPKHPKTGISFDQFQLPLWPQACRLVKETAPKFLPIRTIGWDVALTPNGPFIVEGNIWWDPPNQHRNMDIILNVLACNLQ